MPLNTVANQFLAALGLERLFEKAVEQHLSHVYWKILMSYRKEVQFERARLMRQVPMDYLQVRRLDRELEDINTSLRDIELERLY